MSQPWHNNLQFRPGYDTVTYVHSLNMLTMEFVGNHGCWDVMPCHWMCGSRRSNGKWYIHLRFAPKWPLKKEIHSFEHLGPLAQKYSVTSHQDLNTQQHCYRNLIREIWKRQQCCYVEWDSTAHVVQVKSYGSALTIQSMWKQYQQFVLILTVTYTNTLSQNIKTTRQSIIQHFICTQSN